MPPTDPQQHPIDYLNQIAAPTGPQPAYKSRKLYMLLGGFGFVALVLFVLTLVSPSTKTDNLQTLAARLQSLQTITDDSQKSIKNGELRIINSNLSINLTNTNRDVTEPLAALDVDISDIPEAITDRESGSELSKRLEDARLSGTFDRTYAREMGYEIARLINLMQDIFTSTSSKSLQSFLDTAYRKLQPIQKQFDEFNAANG